MALVNLLFLALAAIALVFQLFTPIILNIPAIAVILLAFVLAALYFRRRRRQKAVPVFAVLNLALQSVFLLLSFAIFFVITIPNESPEDSPAVVQGLRQILVSQGWIAKPRTVTLPAAGQPQGEPATERVNAPDASAVQITVEDADKPAAKEAEAQNP
ncbi:MAG: hypothetical protein ACOY5B_01115 [Spirochaetota bacterium]